MATNLFGSPTTNTTPAVGTTKPSSLSLTTGSTTSAASDSTSSKSWFEEDDTLFLSKLLLGEITNKEDELNGRFNRVRIRLEEDLSQIKGVGGLGSDEGKFGEGDGWWDNLISNANSSGFTITSTSQSSTTTNNNGKKELPKSFTTNDGQIHIRALVDLLGIRDERAVQITLAALRTFAATVTGASGSSPSTSTPTTTNNTGDNKNEPVTTPESNSDNKENKSSSQSEEEIKLRSLLGTTQLFKHVLSYHRLQFISRLRIITECLRLEQEVNNDGDEDNGEGMVIGSCCKKFLDGLDTKLKLNATNNRGLFYLLLRLSTGPTLPGLGNLDLPHSISKLYGSSTSNNVVLQGSEETILSIHTESSEAMLVLLYDRINNGVQRFDLYLIMEALKNCNNYEFGMTSNEYSKFGRILQGGINGGSGTGWQEHYQLLHNNSGLGSYDTTPESVKVMEQTKYRLNGIWGLICAECMGLWHTTSSSDSSSSWINNHPFFTNGLDNQQTQIELTAIHQKINELGNCVRERRNVAYNAYKKQHRAAQEGGGGMDSDDELWGVQAPESICLLSFGLLVRLASMSLSSPQSTNNDDFVKKLSDWGNECSQLANDECGAFAYLHQIVVGMVCNPSSGGGGTSSSLERRRLRSIGNEKLACDLLKRNEFEMLNEQQNLALMDEGMAVDKNDDNVEEEDLLINDAASIVYASIARELLTATIRSFREALLSLTSRTSAVENIGMLADLASVIYRNSKILCESFWLDWEEFCQQGSSDDDAMNDGNNKEELKGGEPLCYLLDAAHTLAVSTLSELKSQQGQQQQQQKAVIHYLKPLATFLNLIVSLCATPSMVRSILTSDFLPDGLIGSALSVVAALAPLLSSLNESSTGHEGVSSEERSTVKYATTIIQSISTLANLGGKNATDWVRKSLSGGPRMICNIAREVLPRTQSTLEGECTDLAASALNLLVDLLVDADVDFQVETCNCFLPISTGGFGGGDKMSGFAQFVVTGGGGEITLGVMSILNSLSVNLTRNVFDPRIVSSSGMALGLIETIGSGVMVALDVLSSLASSGEVTFPTSKAQIATAHAILSSVTATLISLKQVLYLHEDDNVRSLALSVRNDIVSALSSSTPLGQVIAFLSSTPISLLLMKSASSSRNLAAVIDSASAVQHEKKKQNGSSYGPWGKFVTPKRASQRRATAKKQGNANTNMLDNLAAEEEDGHSELYNVVTMALSLLLVWGENAEDIAATLSEESPDQNVLLQASPCTLLLSKASPSSLVPQAATAMSSVANLNLISHLVSSSEDVLVGGAKSDAALLSSKVIKLCLRHSTVASDPSIGLSTFRAALGGGRHMFNVLLDAVENIVGDDASYTYSQGLGRVALLATTMLESVAVSASTQPDLAQSILLGGEKKQDWRLVDKMVSIITSSGELMTKSREDKGIVDERMLNLRSLLTCACLKVVSELWSSCRLTTCKRRPSNSDGAHACESIVAHLTNKTGTTSLVANAVVELTRCSLLAIMSLEEKNSMQDEVSTVLVNQKCILLDMLSLSLDIISIETVSRVQAKAQGGIKFIEDLYDSGPMDCWKVLLSSSNASASAASSWLTSFTESVGRTGTANWNLALFSYANSAEKYTSSSSWCSTGLGASFAKALDSDSNNSASAFKSCNSLQVLAQGEASFSASWASFFEVVTANVYATLPSNEVYALTSALVDCTLTALSSVSVSKMTAESMLSSQGLLESSDTKPVEELCSLLLYSLKVKRDIGAETSDSKSILEMIERLYESSNKLFVMTQLGSVVSSKQETVCLIRQSLLASALVLLSEFESLPQADRSRDDMVKYNDLRIGLTDLAVNALQSLTYVQQGDDDDNAVVEDISAPSKCGYGFSSSASDNNSYNASHEASFQLLRTSLSLLSRLAPTTMGSSSKMNDFLSLTYGVDFASCLKGRNAIHYIQYHLGAASTVASLTYQAVHAGTSTHSVAMIHHNAVDIVRVITVFFHTLTDAGSTVLDILQLLADNRVFRSLIDNPLTKTACKTWSLNSESMGADGQVISTITRHRGYYTSFPRQQPGSKSKPKPCSQQDSAHFVWREVISIFSSLLRSARCQAQTQHTSTVRQVASSTLDFVSAYEYILFSCLTSMLNEAKAQSNKSNKGQSKASFSSSIKSASYAFTPNLLSESSAISSLFAELCSDGDIRNEFARQCSGIYKRVLSTSAEMTKISSAFLGAISSARELFLALESASTITGSSFAEGVHPLLVDGIPHARHEAIRNAHFAHSCCILATAEDFKNSHIATTKAAEAASGKDSSLEQSFQIHVNNKFIAQVESVAGHCLFNALSVLSDTHPASNSFMTFTREEASHMNVAEVIKAGTTVALSSSSAGAKQFQRYQVQSNGRDVQYARTLGVDQSSRTISVEFSDTGAIDRHVPWSCIVGMEDTSKRHCVFSYLPVPRSIAEADLPQGQPSLGNLILSLKWCRHVASTSMNESNASCSLSLVKCIAERTAILLCTEVLLHDEVRGGASPRDDNSRRVNMQLLDLFEDDSPSTDAGLAPSSPSGRGSKQNFTLVLGEDLMASIQNNLQIHLETASIERDEEMKMWAQSNAGWDNSSLLGSSGKRQGRRSPFRLTRKSSSGDLSR